MSKILLSIFALFAISAYAIGNDLNLDTEPSESVASVEILHQDPDGTRLIRTFQSMVEDGFRSVTEGNYMLWNDSLTSICDYVKVFSINGRAEVIKIGTTDRPEPYLRPTIFVSLYFIREKGVWYRVERGVYLRFLKGRYPNMVMPDVEVDENIPRSARTERVMRADAENEEETQAKADDDAKKLKDARAREEVAKASRPSTPVPGGSGDQASDSWDEPSESEDSSEKTPLLKPKEPSARAHKSPKERAKEKGKKSSFLVASALLPALLMLFPLL